MCKKCAKMAPFGFYGLNYWETVEDRWVHAEMRLTSIEFSFDPYVTFTAMVPASQGRIGYYPVTQLTHVHLAIAILLIIILSVFLKFVGYSVYVEMQANTIVNIFFCNVK